MMNSMMRKLLGRSIQKSMGRFLAIMIITMLGAAFFGGLMATEPAFIKTAQHFTNEYNLYDFRILSTYGIDDEDIEKVAELEATEAAVGSVYYDAIVETSEGELIVRIHSITEGVNELMLEEGRMPVSADECVIDSVYFTGVEIGDVITFSDQNEEDTLEALPESYTVVGKVFSPLYMNTERGTTSIGNGKLTSFMYVLPESLDFEYYTEMYIALKGEWEIYSDEYNDYVDELESIFKETANVTVYARYSDIVSDAEQELLDGEQDYADGEQELIDGEQELSDGEQELADQKADGERELAEAWAEIEDGRAQILSARQELLDGEAELADAKAQYEEGLAEYEEGLAEYEDGLAQAAEGYDELIAGESELASGWAQLQSASAQLDDAWAQLEAGRIELEESEEIYNLCVEVRAYLEENPDILDILEYLENSEDGTTDLDTLLGMISDEELRSALEEALEQLRDQSGDDEEGDGSGGDSGTGEDGTGDGTDGDGENDGTGDGSGDSGEGTGDSGTGDDSGEGTGDCGTGDDSSEDTGDSSTGDGGSGDAGSGDSGTGDNSGDDGGTDTGDDGTQPSADDILSWLEENLGEYLDEYLNGETELDLAEILELLGLDESEIDTILAAIEELGTDDLLSALDSVIEQYESGLASYESGLASYYDGLASYEQGLAEYYDGASQLESGWAEYYDGLAQLEDARVQLEDAWQQLEDARVQIEDGEQEILDGWEQLRDAIQELLDGEIAYEVGVEEFNTLIAEAEEKLADARAELDDGWNELADARAELADGWAELLDLEEPEVYILGRDTLVGYVCFEADAGIVEAIAQVFPVFFFLIAALVCSTTMTRMVDEERGQIASLRAMGYGTGAVMSKYLIYAALSAGTGTVIGYFGGCVIFPLVIWNAYSTMYGFGNLILAFSAQTFLITFAAAMLCSVGSAYLALRSEVNQAPAQGLRPKVPAAGKRIFLEYIPFVWKRLDFMRKVTVRNIFRYKKRMFMMILGISGCTALVITGFGIRDSVVDICDYQYEEIQQMDMVVSFQNEVSGELTDGLENELSGEVAHYAVLRQQSVESDALDGTTKSVYLVAADESVTELVSLHTDDQELDYPGTGQVLVSSKLAEECGVEEGEEITFSYGDGEETTLTVSGIFDNYVYHYAYVTPETYEKYFDTDWVANTVYVSVSEGVDSHELSTELYDYDGVSQIEIMSDTAAQVEKMMSCMDAIVLLIIVCAGALAFVVLFNLSNINIQERVREIATIQVLGFYFKEVRQYVFRENLVLSAMGIVCGMPIGVWLTDFVLAQITIDMISFKTRILPASFLYGAVIVFGFTVFVNYVMRGKLSRINMAEALKSIE
ncbi:MAG: ABC transporter permease [Lachnospiraceae bacterium]|nr:ABC transporter permease [Lachnospiraceae bacterium]